MPLDRRRTDPPTDPYDEVDDLVDPWGTWLRDPEPPPPSWWSRLWGWVYRRLG